MSRRVQVRVEAREDRKSNGTKLDRRRHHLPLPFRIRYAVIMASLLTLAAGVGVAYRNTTKLDDLGGTTCLIQSRSLAASHDLAYLVRRYVLPQAQNDPRSLMVARSYLTLVAAQPSGRRC